MTEFLKTEFLKKCPNCGGVAGVAFDHKSGEKFIQCPCGIITPAAGLYFDAAPEFLFKYRPCDGYNESWILNEELFFASPALFNDPFDSKVMYTVEGSDEQKKKFYAKTFEKFTPQIKKRKRWKMVKNAVERKIFEKDYERHIKKIQGHIDTYGVISFSRKPDDLLMFSYYARDHTGYCLKYRRSEENVLSLAKEIVYEPTYPKFSVFEFTPDKVGWLGDRVLLTKAKCWEHEAEMRVSFSKWANRVLKSPHPILEGIILGCNMKSAQRTEIIALNNRREKPVKIFHARKKKFEFALEIFPV